jgi:hypothetical protein
MMGRKPGEEIIQHRAHHVNARKFVRELISRAVAKKGLREKPRGQF